MVDVRAENVLSHDPEGWPVWPVSHYCHLLTSTSSCRSFRMLFDLMVKEENGPTLVCFYRPKTRFETEYTRISRWHMVCRLTSSNTLVCNYSCHALTCPVKTTLFWCQCAIQMASISVTDLFHVQGRAFW